MGAQTTYKFNTPIGQPGGIVDGFTPYAVNSFSNEANDGALKPGMGVVSGTTPGALVKLPAAGATVTAFEGIVTNRRTYENTMTGGPEVKKGSTVGVMRYGCVYAQLAANVTPTYGDTVYLVITGNDAGCFTNASGDNTVAVNGRFIGAGADGIAPVELFNSPVAPAAPYTLPSASATTLGGVKVGTGLSVAEDGTLSVS